MTSWLTTKPAHPSRSGFTKAIKGFQNRLKSKGRAGATQFFAVLDRYALSKQTAEQAMISGRCD